MIHLTDLDQIWYVASIGEGPNKLVISKYGEGLLTFEILWKIEGLMVNLYRTFLPN